MAKKEEAVLTLEDDLKVSMRCPKTKEWFGVSLKWDLYVQSDECETCGSHTTVELSAPCPHCKTLHTVTIRED